MPVNPENCATFTSESDSTQENDDHPSISPVETNGDTVLSNSSCVLRPTPQGSPGVGRNTFLSSPHLCFIIVFICDLFVSRDDPLMS